MASTHEQGVFDQAVGFVDMESHRFELDRDNVSQSYWVFGLRNVDLEGLYKKPVQGRNSLSPRCLMLRHRLP